MKQWLENMEISQGFEGGVRIKTTITSYLPELKNYFTNFPYGVTEEEIAMYCLQTGTSVFELKCLINQLTQIKANTYLKGL